MFSRISIIIFFAFYFNEAFSQGSSPGGSVRLTVLGGGNVDFVFNSINEYKNGKQYLNWTTIGITVTDSVAAPNYLRWELKMKATTALFTGSNPLNTMPLNILELSADPFGPGCAGCSFFFLSPAKTALTAADVVLVNSGAAADAVPPNRSLVTDQVSVSYYCGQTVSLLGNAADYYVNDIQFTLEMFDF